MNQSPSCWSGLKMLNLFTKPVTLLLQNENGHKTYLGVILTIVVIGTLGIMLYQQALDTIFHMKPVQIITQVLTDSNDYYFDETNFDLSISSQNNQIEKVYNPKLQVINQNINEQSKQVDIPLIQCQHGYCIDWDQQSTIQLTNQESHFKLTVELCDSNTNPSCSDDVVELSKGDSLMIKLKCSIVNINNYEQPLTNINKQYTTQISQQFSKQLKLTMQPYIVNSDDGYILETINSYHSYQVVNHFEQLGLFSSAIFQAELHLDNITTQVYRTYPKVQDVLSNVGGFFEILYLVFYFIILPFINLSYKVELLNQLFNFKENTLQYTAVVTPKSANEMVNSIFRKTIQIEKINRQALQTQTSQGNKSYFVNSISDSIVELFKAQTNTLKIGCCDYFICGRLFRNNYKSQLIKQSMDKINSSLDIIYIIRKLQEVDKLKQILLNENQLKLFDYLPKPIISGSTLQTQQEPYYSILRAQNTPLEKALEAQKAYHELVNNPTNSINSQLFKCIDEDLLHLFQLDLGRSVKPQMSTIGLMDRLHSDNTVKKQCESEEDSIESIRV